MLNHTVKIFKVRSKSAGNCFINKIETSETLCSEISINTQKETIKNIPIHVLKYIKLANDTEFGHCIADLIDEDGHFNSKQQLVIVFNLLNIQLAYYIRERIGHGTVRKIKQKNAVILIIATKKEIKK
jgi:hypothetical protein